MQACTFLLSFFTAHFKRHETKKFRSTYILPPPTVIWGIIGAILGEKRENLEKFIQENNIAVGAELCNFKALAIEKATLMTWENERKSFERTVEDFEFLVEPCFRIGISAQEKLLRELNQRIEKRNFEFDIYGGLTDCFLKDLKNESTTNVEERDTQIKGMIPVKLFDGFLPTAEGSRVIRVLYLNTFFYQGFKVEFKVKNPVKVANGIALWGANDVKQFREGNLD